MKMHTEGQLSFRLEVWAENIEGRKSSLKSSLGGLPLCQELFEVNFGGTYPLLANRWNSEGIESSATGLTSGRAGF